VGRVVERSHSPSLWHSQIIVFKLFTSDFAKLYAKFFTKLSAKCCTSLEASYFEQKNRSSALIQQAPAALKIDNMAAFSLAGMDQAAGRRPPQTVMQMMRPLWRASDGPAQAARTDS
jgi:hypothetical protein